MAKRKADRCRDSFEDNLKGQEDTISRGSIEVCRIMHPDDANIAGNVHGGTALKLIEEGGFIIATRHCNKHAIGDNKQPVIAALARVERTDFLEPMYIGEVAQVYVELGYASKHSLEVKAFVWAENLTSGRRRLTNRACLWYVPVTGSEDARVIAEVPPMEYSSIEEEEDGRKRYERQKRARLDKEDHLKESSPFNGELMTSLMQPDGGKVSRYGVANSQSSLIHSVQPSDCTNAGYVQGGVTMKMMDEVAGIVAFRHCKTNVVTASIDAIDFHSPVKLGHVMHLSARATFTSKRSMEIEVVVDARDYISDKSMRSCSAFFTFVSLDDKGHPQALPPLEPLTDEERTRFEGGKKRYTLRKEMRASHS